MQMIQQINKQYRLNITKIKVLFTRRSLISVKTVITIVFFGVNNGGRVILKSIVNVMIRCSVMKILQESRRIKGRRRFLRLIVNVGQGQSRHSRKKGADGRGSSSCFWITKNKGVQTFVKRRKKLNI